MILIQFHFFSLATKVMTRCSRVLEKLVVRKLAEKFLTFCGTWIFITVFKDINSGPCVSHMIPNHNLPSYISEIILVFSACLHLHLPSGCNWGFLSELFIHFASPPTMQRTPPISSTLVRSKNHEFPYYAVFSSLLLTSLLLGPNSFLSTLFLNTLSLCSSLIGGPCFTSMQNKETK